MKFKISPFKRILAVLLILATLCSVFASCTKSDEGNESDSNALGSDISTDANGNTIIGSNTNGDNNANNDIQSDDSVIPIFANGQYVAKIIRGELATTFEKEVYNKIKELFKNKTGVNPKIETDFVTEGEELYNGPAILIGETAYAESKAAYKKLANDQSTATLSGNKYVIAISSADSAEKLINTLKNNISKRLKQKK
jgi:hypothetical protein